MRFSCSTHLLTFLSLETLTSIIRTGLTILVELINLVNCYNFSISNDLTQMVNFPIRIPACDSHSPALLDYFFLLKLVLVLQWLSLHWEILMLVSVSIDFPSNSRQAALLHCIAYNYSRADWDRLRDHFESYSMARYL